MASPFATPGITFGVDASQNFNSWGNVEPITLTSPYKNTGNKTFPIPTAKRRNPTYKEQLPSGGVYGSALITWLLPATLVTAAGAIGSDQPEQAFQITDGAGIVWTVQDAKLNTLKSTWVCVSLNLKIVYNLQDTLTLQRPVFSVDAASSRTYPTYTVIAQNIPCRFQETGTEVGDERGKRLTVHRYDVPVAARLYTTVEDQVVDQSGNVYEVLRTRDSDRIDQLQVLECKRAW